MATFGTAIQGGAASIACSDSARNNAASLSLVQTAGVVSVQVFSADGSPAGGAQVTVKTPDGRTLLLNADSSGFALFGVSEPGSYVFESGSARSTLSFSPVALQPLAAAAGTSSSGSALSGLAIGLDVFSLFWRYIGFIFLAVIVLGYAYWRHRESRERNLFR